MKYIYIGWCKKDNHDKVWGIILLHKGQNLGLDSYVTFWGRRGAKLQTKMWEGTPWDASKLFDKKEAGGYRVIDPDHLEKVYPEFEQDLQKTTVWALLNV